MKLGLENKTALVTGSTAGIGFAIAQELLREGAQVIVNGRTQARVDAAVAKLDGKVVGWAADLGTAQGAQATLAKFPHVDILVNNLGVFEPRAFVDITDDEWQRMFEVNVLSGVRLARGYLPRLKEQGWGRLIFISSESGINVPVEMIHYGTTKTANIAVASGLAKDLAGTGVTSNSILVGPTASEGVGTFVQQLADKNGISREEQEREFFRSARPTSLIKRFIDPVEVAALVAYVASDRASATTGAALRVDGGLLSNI
jgi:NAD(P)-dependent dehydrogenase (short-subunit alcohol dehydrogenase family)